MVLQRTPHAVYDILSPLVWSPKYRQDAVQSEVQQWVQELLATIAVQYDIMIEAVELSSDHVHIFCFFPPRSRIA
jgi:REP element-mobilizing transposase RayT